MAEEHNNTSETEKEEKPKLGFFEGLKLRYETWKAEQEEKQNRLKSTKDKQSAAKQIKALNKEENETVVLPDKRDERIYDPFAWTRYFFVWTSFQLIFLIVANVFVWGMYGWIKSRDIAVIDLPPTLAQQVNDKYDVYEFDRDHFDTFVFKTLTFLHQFDFNEHYSLPLLNGLVSPDIYQSALEQYTNQLERLKRDGIFSSLTVTRIENVTRSFENKRISAYVRGYITLASIAQGNAKRNVRVIPYRANIVVIAQEKSQLNKEGYYLIQLSEVFGAEKVRELDEAISDELKKRGIKQ